jgi:hypothetical protein
VQQQPTTAMVAADSGGGSISSTCAVQCTWRS